MRFYTLDLVRFIAAFCVLIYHYKTEYLENLSGHFEKLASCIYSITKFGYLGVNLFFMISGFVILYSSYRRTCKEFLVSRFNRLYPTYWVCVIITTTVSCMYKDWFDAVTIREFLYNMTLVNDYFNVESIDGVYWTLHAELKFYLCIAVLISINFIKKYKIWMSIWLLSTITFLFLSQPFFMGWFIDPYYSSYFLSGSLFFIVYKKGYSPFTCFLLLVTISISLFYSFHQIDGFVTHEITVIDRYIAMFFVSLMYLFFHLLVTERINIKRSALVVALGGCSYPLYLLHSRIGKTLFMNYENSLDPLLLETIITIAMIGLSFLVYRMFVRKPAKKR